MGVVEWLGWEVCVSSWHSHSSSHRDIPMPLVTSGVEHGNLRELALARMRDLGTEVSNTTPCIY